MFAGDWVIQLAADQTQTASAFRHASGVEILEEKTHLWLRGSSAQIDREARLKLAPDAHHYRLQGMALTLESRRVPSLEMPQGEWRPIRSSIEFDLPDLSYHPQSANALPEKLDSRQAELRLVRDNSSTHDLSPSMVLLSLATFAKYVETAPEIRLRRWTFAVSSRGECIVRGEPLPPLEGEYYLEQDKIAVPLGYIWAPRLDAVALRAVVGAAENDLVLWRLDGSCHVLEALDFCRVRRSDVRAAWERVTNG